jgi:ribose 5-phosphate isomerase A
MSVRPTDFDDIEQLKRAAADAALEMLRPDQLVGLGSGSTAGWFIAGLGTALRTGRLSGVRGVPTSLASEQLAKEAGVPLVEPAAVACCDVVVDGADEVAPQLDLIKGLGGALLREKIVAQASLRRVIIADESKRVSHLGERSPLPVEVEPWGHRWTADFLQEVGGEPLLRLDTDGEPFLTDGGNLVYDVAFGPIGDPREMESRLLRRAGVVQTGLFLGMADLVLLATPAGVERLER